MCDCGLLMATAERTAAKVSAQIRASTYPFGSIREVSALMIFNLAAASLNAPSYNMGFQAQGTARPALHTLSTAVRF
jgi:hypothetical protein